MRTKYEFKGTFEKSRHRWIDSVRVELGTTDCPDINLLNMAEDRFCWLELAKEH